MVKQIIKKEVDTATEALEEAEEGLMEIAKTEASELNMKAVATAVAAAEAIADAIEATEEIAATSANQKVTEDRPRIRITT